MNTKQFLALTIIASIVCISLLWVSYVELVPLQQDDNTISQLNADMMNYTWLQEHSYHSFSFEYETVSTWHGNYNVFLYDDTSANTNLPFILSVAFGILAIGSGIYTIRSFLQAQLVKKEIKIAKKLFHGLPKINFLSYHTKHGYSEVATSNTEESRREK